MGVKPMLQAFPGPDASRLHSAETFLDPRAEFERYEVALSASENDTIFFVRDRHLNGSIVRAYTSRKDADICRALLSLEHLLNVKHRSVGMK